MALITKMLGVAVNDCDAGRITVTQLLTIFQDAIDNGDILEENNEGIVVSPVFPLIDQQLLQPSQHSRAFELRMSANITEFARELREHKQLKRWWRFW